MSGVEWEKCAADRQGNGQYLHARVLTVGSIVPATWSWRRSSGTTLSSYVNWSAITKTRRSVETRY